MPRTLGFLAWARRFAPVRAPDGNVRLFDVDVSKDLRALKGTPAEIIDGALATAAARRNKKRNFFISRFSLKRFLDPPAADSPETAMSRSAVAPPE